MRSTVWLQESEIEELAIKLPNYANTPNSDIAESIIKELGVAEARADSSRILSHNYKHIIGKEDSQIPVRLDSVERLFLLTIEISDTVKDKLA